MEVGERIGMSSDGQIWENAKNVSSILAALVIPIAVILVGNRVSSALKERELQGKFVELAVAILREEPTKKTENLREWATQVVNKYSGVPLTEATQNDLINNVPLLPSALDGARFIGRGSRNSRES